MILRYRYITLKKSNFGIKVVYSMKKKILINGLIPIILKGSQVNDLCPDREYTYMVLKVSKKL